jgi:hypothetical protein
MSLRNHVEEIISICSLCQLIIVPALAPKTPVPRNARKPDTSKNPVVTGGRGLVLG